MNRREHYHSSEGAARALGELFRTEPSAQHDAPPADDRERDWLLRTVETIGAPERRGAPWSRWLLAAVVTLGLVGFGLHRREAGPLTFAVDGTVRADGTTIGAGSSRPRDVHFSDGSTFEVEPGAHLRVETSSATGSRLALVDGKTIVHVIHREKAAWALDAGPFEIHVTGTRFSADWDAVHQRLSVELYEGSVQVVGSPLDAPVPMRAGQRLEAGVSANNWRLTPLDGPRDEAAPVPASTTPAVEPAASEDGDGTASPASGARAPRPESDWNVMVQRADFDGIVHEANELGIERCLASCPAGDVRILADAARYSGRTALAERSLHALRKRGPAEAATAAFFLARLDEGRSESTTALSWYESYLKEAPGGAYAAEAMAGKMRMQLQTGAGTEARSTAQVYLTRFPEGVAAATARRILANVHGQ